MSDAVVGLIGVLIGAFVGLVGPWVINRQTTQEARTQSRKEKLEELYLLVGHWAVAFTSHFISLSKVMTNELTYNEHLDLVIDDPESKSHDFQRVEMIVDVYAPELSGRHDEIKTMRNQVNEIIWAHKEQYRAGDTDGAAYLEPYRQAVLALCRECEQFQKEIALAIRLA